MITKPTAITVFRYQICTQGTSVPHQLVMQIPRHATWLTGKGQSAWLFLLRRSGNQRSRNALMKEKLQSNDVRTHCGHLLLAPVNWEGTQGISLHNPGLCAWQVMQERKESTFSLKNLNNNFTPFNFTARCAFLLALKGKRHKADLAGAHLCKSFQIYTYTKNGNYIHITDWPQPSCWFRWQRKKGGGS